METSNLVELPADYTFGIDPDQVNKGLTSLGHVSQCMISPNMSLNPARDIGRYRQTEAIFNVLRDNENMKFLSEHSNNQKRNSTLTHLKCHG